MTDMAPQSGEGLKCWIQTSKTEGFCAPPQAPDAIVRSFDFYPDGPRDGLSPHPNRDAERPRSIDDLYQYLEKHGIQCKTLWRLPTQHRRLNFSRLQGTFAAERIGRTVAFRRPSASKPEYFVADTIKSYFQKVSSELREALAAGC